MRFRLLVPLAVWAALISIGSSLSNPPGQPSASWPSYAAHAVEFLIFGLLAARYVAGTFVTIPRLMVLVLAVAGGAVFGAVDEFHQSFVPGRDASELDWLVDVAGSLGGAGIWIAKWYGGDADVRGTTGTGDAGESAPGT